MSKSKHVFISENLSLQLTKDPGYADQVVGGKVVRVLQAQQPIDFENGRYETSDDEEAEWLRNHRLFGTYFTELPQEVADGPPKKKVADSSGNDPVTVNDLSIPETENYIKNNDLSDKEIVEFTSEDKDQRDGIEKIHDAATKRLEEESSSESDDNNHDSETEEGDTVVKEDITNLNQLKDYVQKQDGVDGRKLTNPDKVLAAAEQLDPPHEFPNLDTGG